MTLGMLRNLMPDVQSREALGHLVAAGWSLVQIFVEASGVSLTLTRPLDGDALDEVHTDGPSLADAVVKAWASAQLPLYPERWGS
jgi:hypothetical protein